MPRIDQQTAAAGSEGVVAELPERDRFVAAVHEGMDDALAGRVQAHAEVKRRMRSRLGDTAS